MSASIRPVGHRGRELQVFRILRCNMVISFLCRAAARFLFTSYGNLPAECHGLVFLCGLSEL